MSWEIYANTKCSKEMKFVKTDDGKGQGEGWHGEWVVGAEVPLPGMGSEK